MVVNAVLLIVAVSILNIVVVGVAVHVVVVGVAVDAADVVVVVVVAIVFVLITSQKGNRRKRLSPASLKLDRAAPSCSNPPKSPPQIFHPKENGVIGFDWLLLRRW